MKPGTFIKFSQGQAACWASRQPGKQPRTRTWTLAARPKLLLSPFPWSGEGEDLETERVVGRRQQAPGRDRGLPAPQRGTGDLGAAGEQAYALQARVPCSPRTEAGPGLESGSCLLRGLSGAQRVHSQVPRPDLLSCRKVPCPQAAFPLPSFPVPPGVGRRRGQRIRIQPSVPWPAVRQPPLLPPPGFCHFLQVAQGLVQRPLLTHAAGWYVWVLLGLP